ncbi:MAG: hypothetical protein LJE91_01865 [Gammaproteobacteria bacterium]|nr:hypothetical protein [Gammaproteobacteria bacterium]
MKLKQVSEHVYCVQGIPGVATDNQGFSSNASAVVTDKGVVVIDALGTPSLAALFPFTGGADTAHWLDLLEKLDRTDLTPLVPGHGAAAKDPDAAVALTRDYLRQVRSVMKAAVDEMVPFDEAYDSADWSEFENLPAFDAAHRRNTYGVYLSMEQELLAQ